MTSTSSKKFESQSQCIIEEKKKKKEKEVWKNPFMKSNQMTSVTYPYR